MVSGVKKIVSKRQTQYKALLVKSSHKSQKSKISQTQNKMADQAVMNEMIMKAVAEAMRIAIKQWWRHKPKDQKVNEDPS